MLGPNISFSGYPQIAVSVLAGQFSKRGASGMRSYQRRPGESGKIVGVRKTSSPGESCEEHRITQRLPARLRRIVVPLR